MSPQRTVEYEQSALIVKALEKAGKRVEGAAFEVTFPGSDQSEVIVVDQNTITASEKGLAAIAGWLGRVGKLMEGEGLFETGVAPKVTQNLKDAFDPDDPFEKRVFNALDRAGIKSVEQLGEEVEKVGGLDGFHIRNVGDKSKGLLANILKAS